MEFETLDEVANELINSEKKITILYAFNGTGKTRLSMQFMENVNDEETEKILYFNAFTEDLFNWDNEIDVDNEYALNFNVNSKFANILKDSGKDSEIIQKFQYYTNRYSDDSISKIEPNIDFENGKITFNIPTGDDESISNIKISRGEESVFIWSMFYVLVEEIIEKYNDVDDENDSEIKYIFVDDPVSSLDDNHLMNVALDLSKLLSNSNSSELRFILTTHHPLFYNVLHNEFKKANKYIFKKFSNKYILDKQTSDSPFAYHLEIKKIIELAIINDEIQKYHFVLLRNLLEKTATFLGYSKWSNCILEDNRKSYVRIINLHSHNSHSHDEYKEPQDQEKAMFRYVFENFVENYKWNLGDENE